MTFPASAPSDLIDPGVDAATLFERAERLFEADLEILRLVAASRLRALFVCRDRVLKRQVALRAQLTPGAPERAWFDCETELLAALDHPVLRPVYTAGEREEWAYRVEKWVEGESLAQAVARGPRPVPAVLQLARDLISFLVYVHSQRIVLRQLAPQTVMIDTAERTIVTDLRHAQLCLPLAGATHTPAMTPLLGPEIRDGSAGEPASDIYSVGALLYYAVTGTLPEEDPASIIAPRELRGACPRALERVIMRALRADPAERFLTAAEMGDDLLSELGDYDVQLQVPPPEAVEDGPAWEMQLRRALGDDYELLEKLGAGGFGRVYRVRDLALEREVALKVLHPYLTEDPYVVERFRREAQLAAAFMHPTIANVHDFGGRAGFLWYTMEYVKGTNLAQLVSRDGPQPVGRVVQWLLEALDALAKAHERGMVHRDLKPENILIDGATGRIAITDFGLALAIRGDSRYGGASAAAGTPGFASPEQLLGEESDHRTDIYSLSLVGIFALSAKVPFEGGSVESVVARQDLGRLPDVAAVRPEVPARLVRVLRTAAARRPDDRYPSATDFAAALREATQQRDSLTSRWMSKLLGRE
ncbi:MAG: serine/threonine-protein kinase [Gemmatimonadales bacterium]